MSERNTYEEIYAGLEIIFSVLWCVGGFLFFTLGITKGNFGIIVVGVFMAILFWGMVHNRENIKRQFVGFFVQGTGKRLSKKIFSVLASIWFGVAALALVQGIFRGVDSLIIGGLLMIAASLLVLGTLRYRKIVASHTARIVKESKVKNWVKYAVTAASIWLANLLLFTLFFTPFGSRHQGSSLDHFAYYFGTFMMVYIFPIMVATSLFWLYKTNANLSKKVDHSDDNQSV